ncbi:MAG: hypothetical protein GX573_23145 [Chloroflexi bacterium]|nr:hypothetical protein [Chloroflexota bacterium]
MNVNGQESFNIQRALLIIVLSGLVIGSGIAFVRLFEGLPTESASLAIDWKGLWHDIRGGIHYEGTLRNPPWSVLILWPVTQLAMKTAWGLAMYVTLIMQMLTVPRTAHAWKTALGALLLMTSFPSLRHMADGNLEGLLIGGLLLIGVGIKTSHPLPLASGILLASAKPQSFVLLMPVLGLTLLITLPRQALFRTAGLVLAVVLATLIWRGQEWWVEGVRGNIHVNSLVDISLNATLGRLDLGPGELPIKVLMISAVIGIAGWVCWTSQPSFSRAKMGLLVAGSLLVSPYAAGNSLLTVLAIGIIPFFQARPLPGLVLIMLINASWWPHIQGYQAASSNYTTLLVGLAFLVLAWHVWREESATKAKSRDTLGERSKAKEHELRRTGWV